MNGPINPIDLQKGYDAAVADRRAWENLWSECADLALPNQSKLAGKRDASGRRRTDQIFDATACDAVDQLATALLGQVTPPWSPWFGLRPGPALSEEDGKRAAPRMDAVSRDVFAHIQQSNFTVEMHQCYLDLVTLGTACICVHEAEPGAPSAFRFEAVPMSDIILAEGQDGRLSSVYRPLVWTQSLLNARFPDVAMRSGDDDEEITVIEAVFVDGPHARRVLFLPDNTQGSTLVLHEEKMTASPYVAFRWQKASGERYGRSPVMKALPDIKTANKVVELILKNASIAVTGIWQADDDGVLNPATVTLEPGTIIPKAVGSAGLKPLEMPSQFDVSQLILEDLRKRIRAAMLVDRLSPSEKTHMTATEVMERSAENALLLAATYGRLQAELLVPLVERAFAILMRRGEIPFLDIDGRAVTLDIRSPIAAIQSQRAMQSMLGWIDVAFKLGDDAISTIDRPRLVARIASELGVPADLLLPPQSMTTGETANV